MTVIFFNFFDLSLVPQKGASLVMVANPMDPSISYYREFLDLGSQKLGAPVILCLSAANTSSTAPAVYFCLDGAIIKSLTIYEVASIDVLAQRWADTFNSPKGNSVYKRPSYKQGPATMGQIRQVVATERLQDRRTMKEAAHDSWKNFNTYFYEDGAIKFSEDQSISAEEDSFMVLRT